MILQTAHGTAKKPRFMREGWLELNPRSQSKIMSGPPPLWPQPTTSRGCVSLLIPGMLNVLQASVVAASSFVQHAPFCPSLKQPQPNARGGDCIL
jgi:hypothetical protein